MANLNGPITVADWTPGDDHVITGDITVTLTSDFAPTGTITSTGGSHQVEFTAATDVTVDLRGITMNTEIGKWLLNDNNVTVVIGERAHLGSVQSGFNNDFVDMQGGTLRIQGTSDVTFESNAGILATHATNSGTIDIDIDKNDGTGDVGSNGILSVNNFRIGVGQLNITGGDNSTYLPTFLLLGNSELGTGTLDIDKGVSFELRDADLGVAQVNLRGDLRGYGNIDATVTSVGGRVIPGWTVGQGAGDRLTIDNLVLDSESILYFAFEADPINGNYSGDVLVIDENLTLNGRIITVPYSATINNISSSPFTLIQNQGLNGGTTTVASGFSYTSNYTNFSNYIDDNNPDTPGTFNHTPTIALASNSRDIELTLA